MKLSTYYKILDFAKIIMGRKIEIPFLVLWVGQKCTLKCKNCGNLIPYMEPKLYKTETILTSLKKFNKVSNIHSLQIQGGEPFIHPDIHLIIDKIMQMNIKYVEIATNGVVKLNQKTIDVLKKYPELTVRISNYSCHKNIRENFVKVLQENQIKYFLYDFMYGNGEWYDSGGINEKRINDEDEVKLIYKNCGDKGCNTLADGIFTVCGKIPAIKKIYKKEKQKLFQEINVIKTPVVLLLLLIKIFYFNIKDYRNECRYCLGTDKRIKAAIQIGEEE